MASLRGFGGANRTPRDVVGSRERSTQATIGSRLSFLPQAAMQTWCKQAPQGDCCTWRGTQPNATRCWVSQGLDPTYDCFESIALGPRKSGLPYLRDPTANLGQARDRCLASLARDKSSVPNCARVAAATWPNEPTLHNCNKCQARASEVLPEPYAALRSLPDSSVAIQRVESRWSQSVRAAITIGTPMNAPGMPQRK